MKKYYKFLIFVPFIIGTIGFMMANETFLNSAFNSVLLYTLNYEEPASNIYVEIARWTAPIATTSGILLAIIQWGTAVKNYFVYKFKKDSVAVYGDNDEANAIKTELKGRLITTTSDKYVKAKRYILFDNEEKNLSFYAQHRDTLKDIPVCLKCSTIRSQDLTGDHIKAFNVEETVARLFWRNCGIYSLAKENNYNFSISIIGFDKLGQEVLLKGLQDNLFDVNQNIEYHVYGNSFEFEKLYTSLNEISDKVFFHDNWLEDISHIQNSQMVIVTEITKQLATIKNLLFGLNHQKIHVLSFDDEALNLLEEKDRLYIYDWKDEILKLEYLFNDKLYEHAQMINLRYAHIYSGTEETKENAVVEWKKLNSFTKYSNISCADYHEVRLEMLKDWDISSFEDLAKEQLEILSELEHIRWCRYHYLNNWKHGEPENGKAKDFSNRIHRDLIPYSKLTEEEKEKDRENIRVLLSVKYKNI